MLNLTEENYYSPEANMAYMSASQFKAFLKCEAAALAELKGEYVRPKTEALMVGSYVDALVSDTMDEFVREYPEAVKKNGEPKACILHGQEIYMRLMQDELSSMLLSGRHQVIKTGVIAGVPFKIKMDSLLDEKEVAEIVRSFPETAGAFGFGDGAIVDLKTVRDFADVWSNDLQQRVHFIEGWGYDYQGAIYQAVDGRYLPFIIMAATKEPTPDIEAFLVPDRVLEPKLEEVRQNAPRFQAVKEGKIPPTACGSCPYCLSRKKLTKIKNYMEKDDVEW